MKTKLKLPLLVVALLLMIGLIGCSNSSSPEKNNSNNDNSLVVENNERGNNLEEEPEEVTIRISPYGIFKDENNFQKYYVEPLAEVYPYIKLELVEASIDEMEDHFLAGTTPDIFASWNGDITALIDMQVASDLFPLADSIGADLSRFVDTTLDSATSDGKLYGLPYAQQFNALYYNKDIFDKFGVDYPEDGMTWDEVIELAKRVTGERDGIQIKGLSPSGLYRLLNPLSLGSPIEYGTLKNLAREQRDDFVTVLETVKKIYSIPGNMPANIEDIESDTGVWAFVGGHVAMVAALNITGPLADADFEWGVVQYPSYPQAPNTYEAVDAHYHFILNTTEHPEEAFKVIDFFSSPDSQRRLAREASLFPVLDDVELMLDFIEASETIGDVDFTGVFKSSPAEQKILHESRHDTRKLFYEHTVEMLTEGKDINTIMNEYEQEIDIIISDYEGRD